jgi:hypothetical protein
MSWVKGRVGLCFYGFLIATAVAIVLFQSRKGHINDVIGFPDGFGKLPIHLHDVKQLVSNITPNKKYSYWSYTKVLGGYKTIIRFEGDSTLRKRLHIEKSGNGFFPSTSISQTYSYVEFIDNDTMRFADNETDFIKFIGRVDNIEEATLIAKLNDLHPDYEDNRGSCYRETTENYQIYLMSFEKCPESRQSVLATISKSGKFDARFLEVYQKSEDCYSH